MATRGSSGVREAGAGAPTPAGAPRWLLVKGRSGMGNRMLAVLTGILYARASGRRLVVDWGDGAYSAPGVNVFHDLFHCPSCDPGEVVPATASITPPIWDGRLDATTWDLHREHPELSIRGLWKRSSLELTAPQSDAAVAVVWLCSAKVPLLRSPLRAVLGELRRATSTDMVLSGLLREELVPQSWLQERIDAAARDLLDGETVGVHVRYTDRKAQLPRLLVRLDAVLRERPGLRVFLATDGPEVAELFARRYPGFVATSHRFADRGKPLHYGGPEETRRQDAVEALTDLYLLGACDHLVVDTSSSFSYVATLLSRTPRSHIHDVNRVPPRLRELLKRLMPAPVRWGI